jgi:hypothetical protein
MLQHWKNFKHLTKNSTPNNAVLVVAGRFQNEQNKRMDSKILWSIQKVSVIEDKHLLKNQLLKL